jgi:pimeloyl-ACP methyl ester carboxylesterase
MFSPLNKSRLEEKIMEISEIAEVHDPEGIAASIEGMKQREDFSSLLAALPLPILFFFGSHDYFIPAEVADRVKEVVPNARYVQLENSGHNGFLEEPQKCLETLVNFSNL